MRMSGRKRCMVEGWCGSWTYSFLAYKGTIKAPYNLFFDRKRSALFGCISKNKYLCSNVNSNGIFKTYSHMNDLFSHGSTYKRIALLCLSVLSVFPWMASSCTRSSDADKVQTIEEVEQKAYEQHVNQREEVYRMAATNDGESVAANGHTYAYRIARTPVDSLGIVTDTQGYKTVDNAISLAVSRDSAQVLSHRFTRAYFKPYLSASQYRHYVLMNMVYDRMTPQGMRFAVTLGEGSADDVFVQFALTVGSEGALTVAPLEVFEQDEIERIKG